METIKSKCGFCKKSVFRRKQAKDVKIHFCGMKCKANYQRLAKPVTEKWLIKHYVDKKMDCVQIGKLVKRDPKTVWNWLKDFKIPTRPRGHNTDRLVKDGSLWKGRKHSDETKQKIREIMIASGSVPFDPKVGSYMKGRKGKDTTNWKGGITPERQAFYSSKEWSEVVKEVWKRDEAKCQRCGKHHSQAKVRGTFHIHHIVSFQVRELRAELSNLLLLCRPCHLWIHSKNNVNKEYIKETKTNEN